MADNLTTVTGCAIKPLQWSEATQPNEQHRYDHVLASSALGVFSIEWKGWKKYDSPCLMLDGDFLEAYTSVDEAKAGAAAYIKNLIDSLLEPKAD